MVKRKTPSRRLRVYFTYSFAYPALRKGRVSDIERIRRALMREYTVIEGPSYDDLKRVGKTGDLNTIYDSLRGELKGADLVLAYLPKAPGSLSFMNELMIALGLGKKVIVVGPHSVRKKLEPLLTEAVGRTFDSPENLIKEVKSLDLGK